MKFETTNGEIDLSFNPDFNATSKPALCMARLTSMTNSISPFKSRGPSASEPAGE